MYQSLKHFVVFIHHLLSFSLWQRKFLRFQLLTFFSVSTVLLSCAVDFFVPIYAQKVVDSLTHASKNHRPEFRWDLVAIFVFFKILQGVGALSVITCLQQIMWVPVEQHVRHQVQVKFFHHIHKMSFSWMINKKLGDILGALERGAESIMSTLEHLLYSIIPTIANIIIAATYLSVKFGWMYGLIVAVQIVVYIVFAALVTEKRSQYQSSVNEGEDCLRQKAMESLVHYETVKCFGNESLEEFKYLNALRRLQHKNFQIEILTSLSGIIQQLIVCTGILTCSLLLLSSATHAKFHPTPGDYVLLTSFLAQLYGPLNYLAGYYRELRVNIINAESMMEYFREQPAIRNSRLIRELHVRGGSVEFKNVCLASDSGDNILHDISFTIAPNTTVALVGSTGSGKTSIARLLLRLQDPNFGQVLVDGKNVKYITLKSLRQAVGIVPQDTTLFNDTVRNNIRYGKRNATNHEVGYAAISAQIHETILSFPHGYDTIVGERGTRLSGGERQRIAIARAILHNPRILILDEATSALDAQTEQKIQEIINDCCKTRTCLRITHKLAVTVSADCIIVLKNGRIIEKGSHESLMKKGGHFATMWNNQMKENKTKLVTL